MYYVQGCIKKFRDWTHTIECILLDLSLGSMPFNTVPLCNDTSILVPLPLLQRVLEVLFSKRTKNILRFPLDLLHSVKVATL